MLRGTFKVDGFVHEEPFRCPNPLCPGDRTNLYEGPTTTPKGHSAGRGRWVCDDCGTQLDAPSWALADEAL